MSIHDRYTFGIIAGIIANIPVNILDYVSTSLNIGEYHIWQIAASAYFTKAQLDTLPALFIGMITDYATAGLLGVISVYLLYLTGKEYYLIKGISIGIAFWILFYGVILRSNITRIDPTGAGTNLSDFTWHIILGVLTSWFIVKYGKHLLEKPYN